MMETWEREGGYMNHILYGMCAEQPDHDNPLAVAGKLELVGRAYSAAPSRGTQIDKFYANLAATIVENGDELDIAISKVRGVERPSLDVLPLILKAHSLLDDMVVTFISLNTPKDATRSVNHRISFCSKYLHFHAPTAFPIYDSVVVMALNNRQKSGQFEVLKRHKKFVGTYATFCRKLIVYGEKMHSTDWTPRSVDAELYGYDANKTLKNHPVGSP